MLVGGSWGGGDHIYIFIPPLSSMSNKENLLQNWPEHISTTGTAALTLDGSAGTRWDERLDIFLNHSHVSPVLLIDLAIFCLEIFLRIVSAPKQSTDQIDSHLFQKTNCKMCGLQKNNCYKLPLHQISLMSLVNLWVGRCDVFFPTNNKRL